MTNGNSTVMPAKCHCNVTCEKITIGNIHLTHGWLTAIVLGVVLVVLFISWLFTFSCCIYYCVKSKKKSRELKALMQRTGRSGDNEATAETGNEEIEGHYEMNGTETSPHDRKASSSEENAPFYDEVVHSNTQNQQLGVVSRDAAGTKQQVLHTYAALEADSPYWEPPDSVQELYRRLFQQHMYPKIPESDIKLKEKIGIGEFGAVYKAQMTYEGSQFDAAVKTLVSTQDAGNKLKLLKEAAIMGQFQHPHVVRLYGMVESKAMMMIVMEYLPEGDLREYLIHWSKKLKSNPLKLLQFCQQIAQAMEYLAGKSFIHRDLAARNVLVDKEHNCKIGDFGLSRTLEEKTYYETKGGRIPVKWTAPEAIMYRKYSTKSDVWSYGMVMYEIWTLGHKPFEEWELADVISALETGFCLSPPPGCPRKVYKIMVECWNPDHHKRPSFKDITEFLTDDPTSLLAWSSQDSQVSSKAKKLGGNLVNGVELYRDLQFTYKDNT